ncbi:MAG: transglutaminase family protein, partial [Verrucomicrobiota bacterium]
MVATLSLGASPDNEREEILAPPIEELVELSLPSIVTVTHRGRTSRNGGLGTGFVIGKNGLIATNLHVIGEARAIDIELSDGRALPVTEVFAWDRRLDLAIVRVAANDLKPIPLGDSDSVRQGTELVAFGNPGGLKFSVVKGLVSAIRELNEEDGVGLIQVAMPIEPGNSGGPILNRKGEVLGVVTFKEAFSDSVGFAMPVNFVKSLLESPNRIPMDRWVTIGALRPELWEIVGGGIWTQRAGVITAAQQYGQSFGGRTLCISKKELPSIPYEISANVRLETEDGAAGLVFASDGQDVHYGFYPSNGLLRLTRFDGPDLYSWTVLEEIHSDTYRHGEWNELRVRLEADRILCFVNGEKVIESTDAGPRVGSAGFCKFRNTRADFQKFRTGNDLAPRFPDSEVIASLTKLISSLDQPNVDPGNELTNDLAEHPRVSQQLLNARAERLEESARRTRVLASEVHTASIIKEIVRLARAKGDRDFDLFHAGLVVSKLSNPEIEIEVYLNEVARMSSEILEGFSSETTDSEKLIALNRYLFEENGFHGSRTNYYHPSNSFLNEVLDDREGLPISLAIIYMELAQRIGLDDVSGVDLPGHYITQYKPRGGKRMFIDVFDGGTILTRKEVAELVLDLTGMKMRSDHLHAASNQTTLLRLINNLIGLELARGADYRALAYLDMYLALEPSASSQRLSRAVINFQNEEFAAAEPDIDWLLDERPPGMDLERLQTLSERL